MTEVTHVVKFWDALANNPNYRDALVGWYNEHMADESEKDNLFRGMEPNKEALALEFGYGPGRNMIKFRDMFKRIDGVDISSVILEKLVLDVTAAGLSVPNTYHINGYTLDGVPDSVYDVVTDLENHGFHKIDFRITDPVQDQHPKWIWTFCEKA